MVKIYQPDTAQYLIFCCGSLMTSLIPEIEKLSAYEDADIISKSDIDAVVTRMPEADIFDMTDSLSKKNFDRAAGLMAGLLQHREHPIMILAMSQPTDCGGFMRQGLRSTQTLEKIFVSETCGIRFDFIINKLMHASRGFSEQQLARFVTLCADCDYAMKSSGADNTVLLKNLLMNLAQGVKS